uniref:DNA mismatch repair proteins mutS family domain-containing protein n=1 Tax=viral metagenome TaxID=1070528 RepID=A0A6C0H4F4_9ZZZZ
MELIRTLISYYEKGEYNTKDKYSDAFKLPIEYLDTNSLFVINNNIINDLELVKVNPAANPSYPSDATNANNLLDISNANNANYNLYYHVFDPKTIFEKNIINKWSKYYTNNKEFLSETQDLIKNYSPLKKVDFDLNPNPSLNPTICKNTTFYNNCEQIIYDNGFTSNYQYIDMPILHKFNNNSIVLQALSIYNLSTPVISLAIPILFMLLPFFIIKLQGHKITLNLYFNHLRTVFSNHIIGKLFSSLSETNLTNKIYIFFSFGFYVFQLYLNINGCIKYFRNIKYMHNILQDVKLYITDTLKSYEHFLSFTKDLFHYKLFNERITKNIAIFKSYLCELRKLTPYSLKINKLFELGQLMKCFYYLNRNDSFIRSLYFSFGFNGYVKNIESLQKYISNKVMNYCTYNNNKPTKFDNAYFANLNSIETDEKPKLKIVKNSYKLDKNIIITGPNASGKTTLLKSTLFNILLCQQIGCGFFDGASIKIYDYIHCYINIPDTGGRDSLYQAEARQCKNILQLIENNKDKNHFCVFDELYSGTNPDEAITSAYGYLNHLNKLKNIDYMLTTHYNKLCKKLTKQNNNFYMNVKTNSSRDDFEYTYKIKKGISKVKGALKVLKDLEYPDTIITNMK